jgi:uncharacterized protein (DUF1501 family)
MLAFSAYAPLFLTKTTLAKAPAAEKDRTILVLVQLAGGNDGLNTLIPYSDSRYYGLRPTLAIPEEECIRLDDNNAFHPACDPLRRLLDDGKLAVLQNVGYPNPNRSHFRSMEIWETASGSDRYLHTGWLGRFFDNDCCGSERPSAVHFGNEVPQAFLAREPHSVHGIGRGTRPRRRGGRAVDVLEKLLGHSAHSVDSNGAFLQHTMMNALATDRRVRQVIDNYRPMADYPGHQLGQSLRNIASLIAGGLETRVYFVTLRGFDTHSNQVNTHANLLGVLSRSLAAFQKDLENHGLNDQVLTMTFSEFGRRPDENGSRGTDHGTAAPLFILGTRCRGGIFGEPPDLSLDPRQPIPFSYDFRQVYATVLDKWFGCAADDVLGGAFERVGFL